jgi:two-component system NarL family sensor kinase
MYTIIPTKKYTCFLLLFLPIIAFTQIKSIDSLKQKIYSAADDDKKIRSIFSLCEYARALNPDTLYNYITLAKTIAERKNDNAVLMQALYYQSIYLFKKDQTDSALALINACIPKLNNDQLALKIKFEAFKSNVLIKANRQKEGIENCLQLLHSAEVNNDTLTQLRAKLSIGWAYMELDQNEEALRWFFEAVKLDQVVAEDNKQAVLYADIADVYNELNKHDSAEIFVRQAIDFSIKKNDFTTLANAYNIYANICIAQNNNAKAGELLQQAIIIRRQIGDPFFIVSDIYQLGIFYAHNHQPDKGIAITKEGIAIAEKEKILEKLPILYEALAANYKAAGDLENYSASLSKIIELKDSLYKRNSAEALSEMQAKYDVQKNENIIIKQKLDINRKNNLLYGILILLAVIIILGYVFFQNRKKNQQLKLQAVIFEQKKHTTAAILKAEENERKRIAEDLHDSVAQKMVVAKLNLEALESNLPELNKEQQHILDNIASLVDESCTEVRSLSHSMMPQAFFKSGLTDAVKDFIDKINTKNLQVNFSAEGNLDTIDTDKEIMIYRIIQECIQNVLKHAKADKLDIAIIAENNEIDVTIEDNGIGFNPELVAAGESIGMQNIRSRINFLNGTLDINSQAGLGTIIAFYIPAT